MSWGLYNIKQILDLHGENPPGTEEMLRAGWVACPPPGSTPALHATQAKGSVLSQHSARMSSLRAWSPLGG